MIALYGLGATERRHWQREFVGPFCFVEHGDSSCLPQCSPCLRVSVLKPGPFPSPPPSPHSPLTPHPRMRNTAVTSLKSENTIDAPLARR